MISYAIAILLIISPGEKPNSLYPYATLIESAAFYLELMDKREYSYFFQRDQEFSTDLRALHVRWECVKNAPSLKEAALLPDLESCNTVLRFNRSYEEGIRQFLVLYPDNAKAQDALAETVRCYQIWDAMRDAQQTYYSPVIRRQALEKVRHTMGEDYANYPPFVPLRYFWRG